MIIDEALSVGDMQFQLKCMDKMKKFKEEGKTILFVSHDTYSIKNFCDEVIWMKDGSVYKYGNVQEITNEYEDFMKSKDVASINVEEKIEDADTKKILVIDRVTVKNNKGESGKTFSFGEDVFVEIEYSLKESLKGIVGGAAIINQRDVYVCGVNTKLDKYPIPEEPGSYKLICNYNDMNLMPGTYHIDIGFFESAGLVRLDYKTKVISFSIQSMDYVAEGISFLKHTWEVRGITNEI
ncbi:Teichoic acids export ATP-binding protein TagH [compost metagenome]